MKQIFLTVACDYCDFGIPKERLHRGFVVYRGPDTSGATEEYVFRTLIDAQRWQTVAGREDNQIYEVFSLNPFRWHLSRGTLRDVVLADHMVEIFPDHRYQPLPNRAFLGKKVGAGVPPFDEFPSSSAPY